MAANPKPRRKLRLSYSLRALLVFITLFMLWGGFHANRGWKERAAADALTKHGASLRWGRTRSTRTWFSPISTGYWRIVGFLWGERFITEVHVYSLEPDVVDALCELPHLESLIVHPKRLTRQETLEYSPLTARAWATPPKNAIRRILSRHRLKQLMLCQWNLNEDELGEVCRHRTLVAVGVGAAQLTEEQLAEILTLPDLHNVFLCDGGAITGDALAAVHGSSTLERIACFGSPVNKEFARFAGRCQNLRYLHVTHLAIDDDFTRMLGPHPSLVELVLGGNGITDCTANSLATMPSLQVVVLPSNSISTEALNRLKQIKPTLQVLH